MFIDSHRMRRGTVRCLRDDPRCLASYKSMLINAEWCRTQWHVAPLGTVLQRTETQRTRCEQRFS